LPDRPRFGAECRRARSGARYDQAPAIPD